jgi:hypothetical protein
VEWILTILFATHTGILTSIQSTCPHGHASTHMERSPTTVPEGTIRSFGALLSPGNLWRSVIRPVSYYALFEWWLLLSQHPGCLDNATSFST